MHLLNIHGVDDVRLDPVEAPEPGENDVVVRVRACGICGSDLSYIKMGGILRAPGQTTPLGHEAAGEVIKVGASVRDAQVGQRVVINPMQTPSFIGSGGPEGAFTEEVLVRDARLGDSLLPMDPDLPWEVAALSEPLAVGLHGVNRADLRPGDKAVVFGCGPIGLAMVLWLVDRGVEDVVALDLAPQRVERALALGARAGIDPAREDVAERLRELHGVEQGPLGSGVGTDAFLDAAGAPTIVSDVVRMAKYQSRLVVSAVYRDPVPLDLGAMLTTEMTITTAVGYPTEMPEVVAALPRLCEKARGMISHRLPFERVLEGLEIAGTPASAKVMIEIDS